MITNVIILFYDAVKKNYSAPITLVNVEDAKRYALKMIKENPYCKDLSAYYVADFDPDTGVITPVNKELLIDGSTIVGD